MTKRPLFPLPSSVLPAKSALSPTESDRQNFSFQLVCICQDIFYSDLCRNFWLLYELGKKDKEQSMGRSKVGTCACPKWERGFFFGCVMECQQWKKKKKNKKHHDSCCLGGFYSHLDLCQKDLMILSLPRQWKVSIGSCLSSCSSLLRLVLALFSYLYFCLLEFWFFS